MSLALNTAALVGWTPASLGDLHDMLLADTPYTTTQFSNYFPITIATLQRNHTPLSWDILMSLTLALQCLALNADTWLTTPSAALENRKPVDLLRTCVGRDLLATRLHTLAKGQYFAIRS